MHKIAVVIAEFHKNETNKMLETVKKYCDQTHIEIVQEVRVPGCLEHPLALKRLLIQEEIEGAVALGIIEKGGTKHGLVMANAVFEGIVDLQLDLMKPIGVGILGPEIENSQIAERVEPYATEAIHALHVQLHN